MKNTVEQRIREMGAVWRRRRLWRRVLSGMMAIVVFATTYALILPAITAEKATFCGFEQHTHSVDAGCYTEERVLACGLDEWDGHAHADECYEERSVMTCGQDEHDGHTHSDECYDESLIPLCGREGEMEHEHSEECYGTACELVCGQEERISHAHSDGCYETEKVLVCEKEENGGHVHSDGCYKSDWTLTCAKTEHTHTRECFSNPEADVETAETWERDLQRLELTSDHAQNVVLIAESQLGQSESEKNYIVDYSGELHGYTRYGAWYGVPYAPWDAVFVSFCLNYAGVPRDDMPIAQDASRWAQELADRLQEADYAARPGDLVFFDTNDDDAADRVGIVYKVEETRLSAIEGDADGSVQARSYALDDETIFGYVPLPAKEQSAETTAEPTGESVATEAPLETGAPDATGDPIATEEPIETERPETPVSTEEPAETGDPTETQLPDATEVPAVTDEPAETEAPENTDVPVETGAPENTDVPVETGEPESTDAPVVTEEPIATEAPQATEEPEAEPTQAAVILPALGMTKEDNVALLTEAADEAEIAASIELAGTQVQVLARVETENGDWYEVEYEGVTGFVREVLIKLAAQPEPEATIAPQEEITTLPASGMTTEEGLALRAEPDDDAEIVETIEAANEQVRVLTKVDTEDGVWYEIEYQGQTDYAREQFIALSEEPAPTEAPAAPEETVAIDNMNGPYRLDETKRPQNIFVQAPRTFPHEDDYGSYNATNSRYSLLTVAVRVEVLTNNTAKGMKGVQIHANPTVEFDLRGQYKSDHTKTSNGTTTHTLYNYTSYGSGTNEPTSVGARPRLWSYRAFDTEGRQLYLDSTHADRLISGSNTTLPIPYYWAQAYYLPYATYDNSIAGLTPAPSRLNSAYNSGTMTAIAKRGLPTSDSRYTHANDTTPIVTFSNIQLDGVFPERGLNTSDRQFSRFSRETAS